MRLGYSTLLGEYIDANALAYHDCEHYQVVCPCCNEPVFKAESHRSGKDIHYLSHYSKSKSYQEDCELRVGSIGTRDIDVANLKSRNQRLQYFFSVLQEGITKHNHYFKMGVGGRKKMAKSKALATWAEIQWKHLRKAPFDMIDFDEIADSYISDMKSCGVNIETEFALTVQKRIAFDLWNMLMSPKGESNYRFLFRHAYLVVIIRINSVIEEGSCLPEARQMAEMMAKIMTTSKMRGHQMIAEMAKIPVGPPYAEHVKDMLSKASSEIAHEMIGALLSLPYLTMLQDWSPPEAVA